MLRFINIFLLVVIGALSVLLYQLKYESKILHARADKLAKEIRKERANIAVLRAEWNLLIRPGRVERLAKKHLGMGYIQPGQFRTENWLGQVKKKKKQASLDKKLKSASR